MNRVYYFSGEKERPTKHSVRLRPRHVASRQKGTQSPTSGERPRKRPRDTGEFRFDLNLQVEEFNEHPQTEVLINREENVEEGSVENRPSVLVLPDTGDGFPASENICNEEAAKGLSNEVEATINIGKVVGVCLNDHEALIREVVGEEGINGVRQ